MLSLIICKCLCIQLIILVIKFRSYGETLKIKELMNVYLVQYMKNQFRNHFAPYTALVNHSNNTTCKRVSICLMQTDAKKLYSGITLCLLSSPADI